MKQKKILDILDKGAKKLLSVNVTLACDKYYYNLIPLKRSSEIVLAVKDSDFQIDGYLIFPVSAVVNADKKGKKYNDILRKEGINKNIPVPCIDISSMRSVCCHFSQNNEIISAQTYDGSYYLGRIIRAGKKSVRFAWFDARGKWYEPVKIKYSHICLLSYMGRYGRIFSKYTEKPKNDCNERNR